MLDHLDFGTVVTALFTDGVPDTSYVVGTLALTAKSGVKVSVPYVPTDSQFASTSQWFSGESPPDHLTLTGANARFELFGCYFSGHRDLPGIGIAEGHLGVEETVLAERDGDHSDPLTMVEMASKIDGLYEWSRLQSVSSDFKSEGEGMDRTNTLQYTVKRADGLSWQQGDATLSISTSFKTDGGSGIQLNDWAVLKSVFKEPRPFSDHLLEQRKFVAFMSLMFGAPVAFRNHQLLDERFTLRTIGGSSHGPKAAEVISRQTIRDFRMPPPGLRDFERPIVRMPEIPEDALTKWSDNYLRWERFIIPIVGLYALRENYVENETISASMSLEALGSTLVGYVDGEEATYRDGKRTPEWAEKVKQPATKAKTEKNCKTVATDIYRSLKPLALPWSGIAMSEAGLAFAIAKNYNSIKHSDRGGFPRVFETRVLSTIASGIARLNALKLVSDDPSLVKGTGALQQFARVRELLTSEGLIINDEGAFVGLEETPFLEGVRPSAR